VALSLTAGRRFALLSLLVLPAAALATASDANRAQLLLKTLSYDKRLGSGSGALIVGVVGPDPARTQLVQSLNREAPPPIKDHPVQVIDCGEQGACEGGKVAKALLLVSGTSKQVLQTIISAAHGAGCYTLGLEADQVSAGAMVGLTADNRTLLNKDALVRAQVEFEPGFARRAQLVGRGDDAPIELPQGATPPVELPGNARPKYPQSALESELEGEVLVRVVIKADGKVGALQLLEGDAVFAEPTLAAMKTWQWSPAMRDGVPITVYRVIRVPFKLQ